MKALFHLWERWRAHVQQRLARFVAPAQHAATQALLEAVPVGMYQLDAQGNLLFANAELRNILHLSGPANLRMTDILATIHPEDRDRIFTEWQRMQVEGRSGQMTYRYLCGDAAPLWVLGRATPQHDASGQITGFIGSVTDLTHERALQAQAACQSRLYATLRQVNAAILHAKDEQTLYQQICSLLVDTGGFVTAGISCIDWDTRVVTLVSTAGDWQSDMAHLVRQGAHLDDPEAHTLTNLTLRTGRTVTVNHVATDERLPAQQREVLQHKGIQAASTVLFSRLGQPAGVLALSANEPDFFNPEVLALLDEVGREMSFALDVLAREREREAAQAQLTQEEHNLRASERLYNTLVNTIPVGIYQADAQGKPTFANPMMRHLNGFQGQRLFTHEESQLTVHPEDRQRLIDTYARALQQRSTWTVSDMYRYLHPDGTVVWARTYATPLFSDSGQFEGFVGAAVEATAEHRYQAKAERLARFYATLTQVNAAIIRSTSESELLRTTVHILVASGDFAHVTLSRPDWARREIVLVLDANHLVEEAQSLRDLQRLPMDDPEARNLTSLALLTGKMQSTDDAWTDPQFSPLIHEIHRTINVASIISVPCTRFGEVVAAINLGSPLLNYFTDDIQELIAEIGRNVSFALESFEREAQRQAAQTQLARQEQHVRVTLHSIGDAVLVTNAQGRVTMMNPVAETLTGWTEAQASGRPVAEVFHIINQETRAVIENPVATVLREGTVVGLANHTVLIARDGTERPIADSGAPIRYAADSDISGVVLVFRDQTDEYRVLQALHDSERRYASLVESSPVGIVQLDRQGHVIYANNAMRHMGGIHGRDVALERWVEALHPDDRPSASRDFQQWLTDGSPSLQQHYRYLHPDGRVVWAKSLVVPITSAEGQVSGYVAVVTDLTAETELRTQTEKLARMYATLSRVNAIITQVKDVDTLYNEVCHAMVGVGRFENTVVMAVDWERRQLHQVNIDDSSAEWVPNHVRHRDLDDPNAQSIANIAVLTGQRVVCNALLSDERLSPGIRQAAQHIHIEAGVALPLRQMGEIVGTLGILSREKHYFTEDIVALLDEIGRDVSHALDNIAREALRQQTEAALARNEERLRLGMQVTQTGMYEVEFATRRISFDTTFMQLLGWGNAPETIDLDTFGTRLPKKEFDHVFATYDAILRGETDHYSSEVFWQLPDGSHRWLRNYGGLTAERSPQGMPVRLMGVLYDITSVKALEERDQLAATVFDNSQEAIVIASVDMKILMVNQAFTHSTGYEPADILGRDLNLLRSERHDAAFYDSVAEALRRDGAWQGEAWRRRKDGSTYPAALALAEVHGSNGALTHYVLQETDITAQKAYEARISHLAYRDALTDLPNRALLRDRMDQSIAFAHREGLTLALLFLDLDHFKNINDTLGHGVGDLLLKEIAQRLTASVREMDTVGRLGGDEFLVLLPDTGAEQAAAVAQKLLEECARAVTVHAHTLMVTPSVGIALYPKDGDDFDSLLKSADTAMYRAKDEGRNAYRFYTPEMNLAVSQRMAMEAQLRQALERQEFVLHYQPQFDLTHQTLVGVEALIRWHQPEIGLVSPAQFIPVAEASGLIVGIGQWVLEAACRQVKAWQTEGLPPPRVAVNVSARQFAAKNIVEVVSHALHHADVSGAALEVEITESLLASDMDYTLGVLQALKALGIRVAIDDFGTGYSSLSYLKRFPIDLLKIDQSFVRDLETDADDRAIAAAIVTMGHSLDIQVIAEGVETERQMAILRDMGCDEAQGYFLGRPMPADQMTALLRAQPPQTARP